MDTTDIATLRDIADKAEETLHNSVFPQVVTGRKLHADADILSYKACNLEESLESNIDDLRIIINTWRKLAGAEQIILHLTMGSKGGREDWAQLKQYQAQRVKEPAKSDRVRDLRQWMEIQQGPTMYGNASYYQEADDTLSAAMRLYNGRDVLYSPDKDLQMVPGMHLDHNTYEITEYTDGYGSCHMTVSSSGDKKLVGKGTSWFWHQLLMGDAADNIPGLPALHPKLWMKCSPTQPMVDAQRRIASRRNAQGKVLTQAQHTAALRKLSKLQEDAKPKKIGQVLAQSYLKNCISDVAAYNACLNAYALCYGIHHRFTSWRGEDKVVSSYDMMVEQARLLWMQRFPGDDVIDWFKELNDGRDGDRA